MTAFCFYCDGIFADGIFFYCDGIFADLVTAFCFPRWYAHVTAFFKNDFRDGILCDKHGIFLNVDGIFLKMLTVNQIVLEDSFQYKF